MSIPEKVCWHLLRKIVCMAAIMTIPSTKAYKNNIGQPLAIISRSILNNVEKGRR
jgi:hypothetical protein